MCLELNSYNKRYWIKFGLIKNFPNFYHKTSQIKNKQINPGNLNQKSFHYLSNFALVGEVFGIQYSILPPQLFCQFLV